MERGIDGSDYDLDKYVYSMICKSVQDLNNGHMSWDKKEIDIVRTPLNADEFSFTIRNKSANEHYVNIIYVDNDGNYGLCLNENLQIDGELKKGITLPFTFDASDSNMTFMVIATSFSFDLIDVQRYIKHNEQPMPISENMGDAEITVNIERKTSK